MATFKSENYFIFIKCSLILSYSLCFAAEATDLQKQIQGKQELKNIFTEHFLSAKRFDPTFLAANTSEESSRENVKYAESLLLPKVTFNASSFQTDRLESNTNIFGQRVDTSRKFSSSIATIQARQSIYRPKDYLSIFQAYSQEKAALVASQSALQNLRQRLVLAWIEIIANRELLSLLKTARTAAAEILEESNKRYISGDLGRLEVELAQSKLAQTNALIIEAESRVFLSERALLNITGPNVTNIAGGSTNQISTLLVPFHDWDELSKVVLARNPEIIASHEKSEFYRLEKEKIASEYKPTVDAYVSTSKGQNDSVSFIKDENRMGLQLNMPIFTFGTLSSALAQADANYRTQLARSREVEVRISTESQRDFANFHTLKSKIYAADAELTANRLLLNAQIHGLKAGVYSRADAARSLQDLIFAQRQAISLRKEMVSVWINILVNSSSLDETFIEEIIARFSDS